MRFAVTMGLVLSATGLSACSGSNTYEMPRLYGTAEEAAAARSRDQARQQQAQAQAQTQPTSDAALQALRDANENLQRSNQGYRPYTPPAVQPIGQPSTEVVWCRDLTDQLIRCQS